MTDIEAKRSSSRVIIKDAVFEKVLESRFCKHVQAIEGLKGSLRKCSSEYFVNEDNIAHQLDRFKKRHRAVDAKLNPPNLEFQNCLRRLESLENSHQFLPKIANLKLKPNLLQKVESRVRIQKENEFLQSKIAHLSLEKENRKRSLEREIESYELYRKISRRFKEKSSEKKGKLKI